MSATSSVDHAASATSSDAQGGVDSDVGVPSSDAPRSRILTQLTWVYGDDDALPGDRAIELVAPAAALGDRAGYRLLGDQLLTAPRDRSNWLLVTSTLWLPGYWPQLRTGAELALAVDLQPRASSAEPRQWFEDAGTYLALRYLVRAEQELELRGYPLDADPLRLGYLDALTFGRADVLRGQSVFPRATTGAPGVRLSYDGPRWTAFGALKTAQIPERTAPDVIAAQGPATVAESNYAGFAGVEWRPFDALTLGAQAAYIEHGTMPGEDFPAQRAFSVGMAARAVVAHGFSPSDILEPRWHFGGIEGRPLEFGLSRRASGKPAWLVSIEAVQLQQRLQSFELPGQLRFQNAMAGALQASWHGEALRLGLALLTSTPTFVLRYGPSLVPLRSLPSALIPRNAHLAVASLGWAFWTDRLRPELQVAIERPATLTSAGAEAHRTLVLSESRARRLIDGDRAPWTLHARASLRSQLSPALALLGWLQLRLDAVSAAEAIASDPQAYVQPPLEQLGFGVAAQARF